MSQGECEVVSALLSAPKRPLSTATLWDAQSVRYVKGCVPAAPHLLIRAIRGGAFLIDLGPRRFCNQEPVPVGCLPGGSLMQESTRPCI